MNVYPIFLKLDGRPCVVVGGGQVAARKIENLLQARGEVTVISPELADPLADLARRDQIRWLARGYRDGDLAEAFLAIAAADDPLVNRQVWQEAARRGCLVNVVDAPELCNFIVPATIRRGDVAIAISTGGASPALARRLRQQVEAVIGPEYADLAALLSDLRPQIQARLPNPTARAQVIHTLLDSALSDVLKTEGREAGRKYAQTLLDNLIRKYGG